MVRHGLVVLLALVAALTLAAGVSAQSVTRKVYWGDRGNGMIWRANLDGSDQEAIVSDNVGSPRQLVVDDEDPDAPMVYWTDQSGARIMGAAADGSQPSGDVLAGAEDGILEPVHLRLYVDANGDKWLYFSDVQLGDLSCTTAAPCSGLKRINLSDGTMNVLTDASQFPDSLIAGTVRYHLHALDLVQNPVTPGDSQVYLTLCYVPWDCQMYETTVAALEADPGDLGTVVVDNRSTGANNFPTQNREGVLIHPREVRWHNMDLWIVDRAHLYRHDWTAITPPLDYDDALPRPRDNVVFGVGTDVYQLDLAHDMLVWTEGGSEKMIHIATHAGGNHTAFYTGLSQHPQGVAVADVSGAPALAVSAMLVLVSALVAMLAMH